RSFEWYFLQRQCVGEKRTIAVHASPVTAVALSPDGRLLVTANSGPAPGDKPAPVEIVFWETATGKRLFALTGHDTTLHCLALHPSGGTAAAACRDGNIYVLETDRGRVLAKLTGHARPAVRLAYHPTEPLLASASRDGTVRLWGLAGDKPAEPVVLRYHHAGV